MRKCSGKADEGGKAENDGGAHVEFPFRFRCGDDNNESEEKQLFLYFLQRQRPTHFSGQTAIKESISKTNAEMHYLNGMVA